MLSPNQNNTVAPQPYTPFVLTDEILTDLNAAGQEIERSLTKDDYYPDLWKLLTAQRASQHYTAVQSRPLFYKRGITNIPDAVLEQYDTMQYKCFLGIFSQINRAWVSIDHKLYLWNYEDPSDFCVYDGLDQIIISVALVTPKVGVFVEDIKYLLVVATAVEIVLVAVTFTNGPEGEISLIPTGLSVPSDNVSMLRIVGMPNGRIFMGGKDGCLYELLYQAEERWFSKRCSKVNHTSSIVTSFLPSFLKFSQDDPIVDIAVDSTRNILFTLTLNRSTIQVYDLGDRGELLTLVAANSSIAYETERLYPNIRGPHWDPAHFRIVSIHNIPITESGPVHLVAVTNQGIRLYFSTIPGAKDDSLYHGATKIRYAPRILELVHVRLPPPQSDSMWNAKNRGPQQPSHLMGTNVDDFEVHMTYYNQGAFAMADARSEDTDVLWGIAPDLGHLFQNRLQMSPLIERAATIELNGKVWAISEEPHMRKASIWLPLLHHRILRNELATQHLFPPRKLLCLTNSGLYSIVKLRAVDQLHEILAATGGRDTEELQRFFSAFGEDQACAMCLILCTSSPKATGALSPRPYNTNISISSPGLPSSQSYLNQSVFQMSTQSMGERLVSTATPDPSVIAWATRAFFKYGGRPSWTQVATSDADMSMDGYGYSNYNTPKILFSHSHDGFCLYFARLLRGVWSESIVKNVYEKRGNRQVTILACSFTKDQLLDLEDSLTALQDFLNKNPQFAAYPIGASMRARVSTATKRKVDEEAKFREQKSLSGLHLLLVRCIEACAFLEILSSNRLSRIIEFLPEEFQARLAGLKYRDLVGSSEGSILSKELVTGLINLHTNENLTVDAITSLLRQKCPSFFSDADRLRFKGSEFIKFARTTKDPKERSELLNRSLEIFMQVNEYLNLQQITQDYMQLHFYTGAVKLSLSYAQRLDPTGIALAWHKAGRPADDEVGLRTFEARMDCYACITSVFDTLLFNPPVSVIDPRDIENLKLQTLQVAMESNDELFHYSLYQWYVDRGLGQELLKLSSIFLENFLKNSQQDYDLLWRYYLLNEKYGAAASILAKLSEKPGLEIPLQSRVEYLARAKTCLTQSTGPITQSAEEIEDKLEVAQIQQKIYEDLAQISGTENELKELDSQLLTLNELFNKYAKKFKLLEAQLSILNSAGHNDPNLVKKIWDQIIRKETDNGKISTIIIKVKSLGAEFYPSEVVFPLGYLVDTLERTSFLLRTEAADWRDDWVYRTLLDINVPYVILFEVYNHIFDSKGSFWTAPDAQMHLLTVLYNLLREWAEFYYSPQATDYDRRQFVSKGIDSAIEKYVTELEPYREAGDIVSRFKLLSKAVFGPGR